MFWNNSRTFYNLSEALGSFGFLPLRGAGTGFVVVLPLSLIFDPPLYILHFTIYTTFHREATLKTALELLDYSVNNNTRVYQIHKEGGVANRFLTARRHFWTPWSERTHCMENGQSVFFLSPHTPDGRVRLARFARVRLLHHTLPISLLILRKKQTVLQSRPFTADRFWSVKFVSPSKPIKRIQWDSFPHLAVIALVIGKLRGIFIASKRKPSLV